MNGLTTSSRAQASFAAKPIKLKLRRGDTIHLLTACLEEAHLIEYRERLTGNKVFVAEKGN